MKQKDKPAIFIPDVLKSKKKRELNLQIKKMIKEDDKMKIEYKYMKKHQRQKLRRDLREALLSGDFDQELK